MVHLGRLNIRVKFQVRGSPHVNLFIWILNAHKLTKFHIDEYTKQVDSIVRSNLLDLFKDLQEIQKRKVKVPFCKLLTTPTIIAQPLENSVPEDIERAKMQHRNKILKMVDKVSLCRIKVN